MTLILPRFRAGNYTLSAVSIIRLWVGVVHFLVVSP